MAGRVQIASLVAMVMTVSHVSAFVLPAPFLMGGVLGGGSPLLDQLPKPLPPNRQFTMQDAVPGMLKAINTGGEATAWGGPVGGVMGGAVGGVMGGAMMGGIDPLMGGVLMDSGDSMFLDGGNMVGTGAFMQTPGSMAMLPSFDNVAVVGNPMGGQLVGTF